MGEVLGDGPPKPRLVPPDIELHKTNLPAASTNASSLAREYYPLRRMLRVIRKVEIYIHPWNLAGTCFKDEVPAVFSHPPREQQPTGPFPVASGTQ